MKPTLKGVPNPKAAATPEEAKVTLEKLNWICNSNVSAVQFCAMIIDIVATYDDLIDKDNPDLNDGAIHAMMHSALFGLPHNKFYMDNFNLLNPIMLNSVANWRIANELERVNTLSDLNIAFIIRSSYADVIRMVAFICGGDAHSIQAGIEIRRYVHAEGMDSYLKEQQGE